MTTHIRAKIYKNLLQNLVVSPNKILVLKAHLHATRPDLWFGDVENNNLDTSFFFMNFMDIQ